MPDRLRPREAGDIAWFFLRNRLVAAEDDPRAVTALLDALAVPAPKARSGRTTRGPTISDAGVPFAIGLSTGRVLLVDEYALWLHNETVRDLGSALARHSPTHIAFEPGSLTIATSPRHRVPVEGFRVSQVWDARTRSWVAESTVTGDTIERVRAAVSQTRTIYFGQGTAVEPIGGERETLWPGTRVTFKTPRQIIVVPTAPWSAVMVLRHSESARGATSADAGTTTAPYAVLVKPEKHPCDQAVVIPHPDYPDTASVWVRLADTKQWLDAGIVPLKYP